MLRSLISLICAFLYINTIVYHESVVYDKATNRLNQGITLIKVVLDDILDLPVKKEQKASEFEYDEYRPANSQSVIAPLILSFLLIRFICCFKIPTFFNRSWINSVIPLQLGYYRYLSLLKPF